MAVSAERVGTYITYTWACYSSARKSRRLLWRARFKNLVPTLGKNNVGDVWLASVGYTAAWYFLLVDSAGFTTGYNVGDTMASHSGWVENTGYSNATRPASNWATAAVGGVKTTSANSVFNMNTGGTVRGVGMTDSSTKGGTTGLLASVGDALAAQPFVNGNVINVTAVLTVT